MPRRLEVLINERRPTRGMVGRRSRHEPNDVVTLRNLPIDDRLPLRRSGPPYSFKAVSRSMPRPAVLSHKKSSRRALPALNGYLMV